MQTADMGERIRQCGVSVAGLCVLGAISCFVGGASEGLPCEEDRDCGTRLTCIDNICGGVAASTTTETTTGETETTTSESTGTTEPSPCVEFDECDPGEPGCTPDCRSVRCGDGRFDPEEACDASDAAWAPDLPHQGCTDDCHVAAFRDDLQDEARSLSLWIVEPARGGWAIRSAQWRSGDYASESTLVSLRTIEFEVPPTVPAGTRLELRFRHQHTFNTSDDCGQPGGNPDGGVIRIHHGRGTDDVAPVGGYPGEITDSCPMDPNPLGEVPAFVRSASATPVVVDLTPYRGESIAVEFLLGYDCGNCGTPSSDAWRVDDVVVAPFPM